MIQESITAGDKQSVMAADERPLTVREAAKFLGVSQRRRRWCGITKESALTQRQGSYCCRSEARSFFSAMAAEWDLPHWHIASSNGPRDFPSGVMAYTTRGGVSGKTVRSTIPVLCNSRSC
jgi:hypothetical protein